MRGRGRSVLSFVFACALIGALAPAAGAHRTAPRSAAATSTAAGSSRWSTARTSPTPPAPTPTPPTPATTTRRGARVDLPHDWSIELDPTARAARPATPATSRAASAGTARPSRCPRSAAGKQRLARVRRRLHGLRTSTSTASRSAATPTATPASPSTSTDAAHRRAHQNVIAVEVQQPAAQQPLVLRQRHLPQRPPRRHRPGARRAPRARSSRRPTSRARSSRASRTCTCDTDGRRAPAAATSVVTTRPATPAGGRVADGRPASPHGRHRDAATCASTTRTCGRPTTPYLYTLHDRGPPAAAQSSTRTTHDASASAGSAIDPHAGLLAQRAAHEDPRRRPAPRPGRARRGGQQRRAHAPDDAS